MQVLVEIKTFHVGGVSWMTISKNFESGTITSSFFFVLSLNSFNSSSFSNPSTNDPAEATNDQTILAKSSALCMPTSFLPLVYPSGPLSSEVGKVLFGFAEELFEIKPDVRTMAPVSRERMRVLCTPGFWLSLVSKERVSSGAFWVIITLADEDAGTISVK